MAKQIPKSAQLTRTVRISPAVLRRLKKTAKSWHQPVSRYLDYNLRKLLNMRRYG